MLLHCMRLHALYGEPGHWPGGCGVHSESPVRWSVDLALSLLMLYFCKIRLKLLRYWDAGVRRCLSAAFGWVNVSPGPVVLLVLQLAGLLLLQEGEWPLLLGPAHRRWAPAQ